MKLFRFLFSWVNSFYCSRARWNDSNKCRGETFHPVACFHFSISSDLFDLLYKRSWASVQAWPGTYLKGRKRNLGLPMFPRCRPHVIREFLLPKRRPKNLFLINAIFSHSSTSVSIAYPKLCSHGYIKQAISFINQHAGWAEFFFFFISMHVLAVIPNDSMQWFCQKNKKQKTHTHTNTNIVKRDPAFSKPGHFVLLFSIECWHIVISKRKI